MAARTTTDKTEATEPAEGTSEATGKAGPPADTETKGATFQEAAKAGTFVTDGAIGFSPERDRTGRRDKGLSQQNPAIMNGGPVPDPRAGIDDSEALAALAEADTKD